MRTLILRGQPLIIHDNEDLSNAIERNGDYWEADILDYLRDNFYYHNTIVDVGANIGNHTAYFARYLQADQILAFEPIQENYDLLIKNCQDFANVWPIKSAISNYNGSINMMKNFSNWGAHEVNSEGTVTAYCYTIDRMVGLLTPTTLIKIDAEWHEPQVIAGAQGIIQADKPLILIEDANKAYAELLPEYTMIKAWEHHNTYLYQWRD